MKESNAFRLLFPLLNHPSVELSFLCGAIDQEPDYVKSCLAELRKAGLDIEESFDEVKLKIHWVFHKKYLTFQEFLQIRSDATNKKQLKNVDQIKKFVDRLADYEDDFDIVYYDVPFLVPRTNSDAVAKSYLALKQSRVISLDYVDLEERVTFREVEPLEVYYRNRTWYLWAYCHLRHDVRLFRLTDEIDVHLTKQHYYRRPYYLPADDEKIATEEYLVSLEFPQKMQDQVYADFAADKIVETGDKYLVVDQNMYDAEYAMSQVFRYADNVRIVAPEELKKSFLKRVSKIKKAYKK